MPLPIAVARCSSKRSMAPSTSSRLEVGACTSAALPAKATTPMRVRRGCADTNSRAAACAALMREGCTSVARMLPEMSIARMTVSCRDGSVTVAVGRATATSISATASRKRLGGMWRRKAAPEPSACRTMDRLA